MKNFMKFAVVAALAVSAMAASAAELEFHGYSRIGFGFNTAGGGQTVFALDGKSKFRLGNEADACIEPSFTYSFNKQDDKSVWGVRLMPAIYRKQIGDSKPDSDGGLQVNYKEYYFYGQNVPQLGGGEIWMGKRQFGRIYIGAITDSFLEAQDGLGAGVYDIPVGSAKLSFDIAQNVGGNDYGYDGAPAWEPNNVLDRNLSVGVHVTNISTFNKDSNLQLFGRVYIPMQKTSAEGAGTNKVAKRTTGFSASLFHVAGFGSAGNLSIGGRFAQNASTDQQDNGGDSRRQLEAVAVYGVNIPSARTSIDAVAGLIKFDVVDNGDFKAPEGDNANNTTLIYAGARSDTQISGPFRFLLEVGFNQKKHEGVSKASTLVKVTPAFAISGGNDPWSRPTFRVFYTYGSWNKEGIGDMNIWKAQPVFMPAFGTDAKTSGGVWGFQAEGWW